MTQKEKRELTKLTKMQKELDQVKWEDSQKYHYDTCGIYDYCLYCDKTKNFPCANAKLLLDKSKKA